MSQPGKGQSYGTLLLASLSPREVFHPQPQWNQGQEKLLRRHQGSKGTFPGSGPEDCLWGLSPQSLGKGTLGLILSLNVSHVYFCD